MQQTKWNLLHITYCTAIRNNCKSCTVLFSSGNKRSVVALPFLLRVYQSATGGAAHKCMMSHILQRGLLTAQDRAGLPDQLIQPLSVRFPELPAH